MNVLVIHGPNLNLLGAREPEVYGSMTLDELNEEITQEAHHLEMTVRIAQSAREGEIIELLHSGIGTADGCLLNPAAYSHTSRAIADAVRAVPFPVIEIHLTNIHAREPWRRHSVTAEAAIGVITGLGAGSYLAGLHALKGSLRT